MEIECIKDIAKDTGMDFCMYERPRMQDIGNDMIGFVSSGNLTPYGKNLIAFANAIEKKLSEA